MILSLDTRHRLKSCYGSWAVVTGASSGIGLELSELLAEAGLNLLICARRADHLKDIADRFQLQYGVSVQTLAADLSTTEGTQALIQAAKGLDVGLLIASAGFGTSGAFINNSLAEEVSMLRVNCEALLSITHHFARAFSVQRRGGIILLSSIVSFQGVPYAAHYAATKAYVQSLAEGLAVELRPYHVDVMVAAPGPVNSGFSTRANMQMGLALSPHEVGAPILQALGYRTTVLPGWLSKLLGYSLSTAPRWLKVRIMGKVMKGFTEHQS